MNFFRVTAAFAVAATLLNVPIHAVQVNVINSYNGASCTGPVNASWIDGVSGVCQIVRSNEFSMSDSCGVVTVFPTSITCQGNSTVRPPTTQCQRVTGQNNSYQTECADHALVAAITLQDSCANTWTPYMYLPVGDCVPFSTNAGGPYYMEQMTPMSFRVVQHANKQLTMTTFLNANCQGTADHTVTVTKDVCVVTSVPLLWDGSHGLVIGLHDGSAPATASPSSSAPATALPSSSAVEHGMTVLALLAAAWGAL